MKNNKKFLIGIAFLFTILFNINYTYANTNTPAKIHFIESSYKNSSKKTVGAGDIILIQHEGKNVVIDGGNKDDNNENKLLNYLKKNNIKKLDWVIVTHMHGDHSGGIEDLVKNYDKEDITIGTIIAKKPAPDEAMESKERDRKVNERYEKFRAQIKAKNINYKEATYEGYYILLGDDKENDLLLKIYNTNYYNPSENQELLQLNDMSLVVTLQHGKDSMLLTGDMTCDVEKKYLQLEKDLSPSKKNVTKEFDAIKVPHHGYAGSGSHEFIETTSPKFAILTAHEAHTPYILAKYKARGIDIYSTFDNGTIIINSDGKDGGLTANDITTQKPKKTTNIVNKDTDPVIKAVTKYDKKIYYYTGENFIENTLLNITFNKEDGFIETNGFKNEIYPTGGNAYFCVNEDYIIQKGWQRINNGNNYDYYYFDNNGKAVTGLQKLKRNIDKDGNIIPNDSNTTENYYYFDEKGKISTGFKKTKIDDKEADYYFLKGANIANKGKLMTSKNGKFLYLNNNTDVYFINADGSKYTKSTLELDGNIYKFDKNNKCINPPQ